MRSLDPEDQEFGDDIAPYVLKALHEKKFFEHLEAVVYPKGDSGRRLCDHSYTHAYEILLTSGFTEEERDDILIVCKSQGGFCDCEILMNVDDRDESPRARYWRSRSGAAEADS